MEKLTRDTSLAKYMQNAFNAELDRRQTEFELSNLEVMMIKGNFNVPDALEEYKTILDIDLTSLKVHKRFTRDFSLGNSWSSESNRKLTGVIEFRWKFVYSDETSLVHCTEILAAPDDSDEFGRYHRYSDENLNYLEMSNAQKIEIITKHNEYRMEKEAREEEEDDYLFSLTDKQLAIHTEKVNLRYYQMREMSFKLECGEIEQWQFDKWLHKNAGPIR